MVDSQSCLSHSEQNIIDLEKWQQTVDLLAEMFDSSCGTIVQLRQNEFNAVVASKNQDNVLNKNDAWPLELNSFCRRIIETKQALNVQNAKADEEWRFTPPVADGPVRSYCGLPLFWPDGQLFGTICVIDTKQTEHSPLLLKLLKQFSLLIMKDLKILCDYNKLKDLALTDELTGIYNRRGLSFLGEQRIKDAKRSKQIIGMIYLDIDNLKQINDHHGHHIGDECILTLTNVLKDYCRESDIIARIGGDEFLIMSLFNQSSVLSHDEQLQQIHQRILQRIVQRYKVAVLAYDPDSITSVSYGQKMFNYDQALVLEDMIEQTDMLMYRNKKSKH
jgi:diguanylate cyclase (GGDEF)-like protein